MQWSLPGLALALGMRHAIDPDHLAVIDSLAQARPNRWSGLGFAAGHSAVLFLLCLGLPRTLLRSLNFFSPWVLLLLGTIALLRLIRPAKVLQIQHLPAAHPLLLGALFAAGFETASQLLVISLAGQGSALISCSAFALGMMLVDGADGWMAALVRGSRQTLSPGSLPARLLGILIVVTSYVLALAELARVDLDSLALPLGLALFLSVLILRVWGRVLPSSSCGGKSGAAHQ